MNADRKSRVKTDCKMPGMAYGGKAEGKMMKAKGRNMTKAAMQKIAAKKVKGHEARMHKGKK